MSAKDGHPHSVQTASPGRIEFIGNHTDYNGGQVLGVAIDLEVRALASRRGDDRLVFTSEGAGAAFHGARGVLERQSGALSWANYPLGIIAMLAEAGHPLGGGLEIAFRSNLPTGAGLSSSAAIELATLEALCALEGIEMDSTSKVLLAQRAENLFVGVPCGMLDQAVSCHGRRDHLVRIDCAATRFETVPLPHGLHFWIFNTNHKHSLVDSMYATRHAECRAALERIRAADPSVVHLAHAPLEALRHLPAGSPERLRAEHVIRENQRVAGCVRALGAGDLAEVGALMFASHESSRTLFHNSTPELDAFVEILSGMAGRGVIGARLTGGGFGGAVMALATPAFTQADAAAVLAAYRSRHPKAEEPTCLHVMTGDGTRRL